MHVPFFLIPIEATSKLFRPFIGLGGRIAGLFPGLDYDLRLAGSDVSDGEYVVASLVNAFVWTLVMLVLVFAMMYARGIITQDDVTVVSLDDLLATIVLRWVIFLPPVATFLLLFFFFTRYPRLVAGKIVEAVDRDLIYALKDLMLQINSGVSLFNAMRSVSRSGYGKVSEEFEKVVQDISTGDAQDEALEKMALRTESEFLRRTTWQIVTALKAGASLQGALASVLLTLRQYQSQNVKAYVQELNLWVLLYIVIAVAIPSLGITLLVVLSTFGGLGVDESFIIYLMATCFIAEFMLVELIKVRRPVLRV